MAPGEFELIARWHQFFGDAQGVELGIGDDAAVLRPTPGCELVTTSDAMVEGVHFDLSYTPLDALGWKALAINLSDVAAMGAAPRAALLNVALPPHESPTHWDALIEGIAQCARDYDCPVVGGDTVRSEQGLMVSITVVGEVVAGRALPRSGAQAGDLLCISGPLGGARTGLEVLAGGKDQASYVRSINRFLRPTPRISEAQMLASRFKVSAMIDVSDGLASEIGHICRQNGVGCFVHGRDIPIHADASAWAGAAGKDPLEYALYSGEKYELLFTLSAAASKAPLSEMLKGAAVIGRMTEEPSILLESGGRTGVLPIRGWDHFS